MKISDSRLRIFNLAGFLACAMMLAYAYYAQFVLELQPCPLCIFQRVAMIALAAVFLLASLHNPVGWGRKAYAALLGLAALAGAGIAGRHVWIQHLPADEVPACGPGLDYMLDVFPLSDAIRMVFTGSGECAEIDWTLLGLSMPAWTLIAFLSFAVYAIVTNASGTTR